MKNTKLPEKTVERLSEYRRSLLTCLSQGKTHIFSHELAQLHNITAVQVRRDIMFIGYSSMQRKGYDVNELIRVIGEIIDPEEGLNVAIIGIGNLGRAITHYFMSKRTKLNIVAAFDVDPNKINRVVSGVKCYPIQDIPDIVKELDIRVALLTVPSEAAVDTAAKLVSGGIKGILNFTTVPLNAPASVYLEEYDMITSLEKISYFVKIQRK